ARRCRLRPQQLHGSPDTRRPLRRRRRLGQGELQNPASRCRSLYWRHCSRSLGGHSHRPLDLGLAMTNIKIRASSLADLFDCPARWYARNILKLWMPTNFKARLGTAVHAGTAAFDQARLDGSPITADAAAGALVNALYKTVDEEGRDDQVD